MTMAQARPETIPRCRIRELGMVEYLPTWHAMQEFSAARLPSSEDEIWILQHPPVYTLGLNARYKIFDNPSAIPVVQSDRGGDISYHAPGQLVVYVLLDLHRLGWGVKQLVRVLEQSVIDYLQDRNIEAERRLGSPGVYVAGKKIAQLGLRIRHGACYHGVSFNVDMDLGPFRTIAPCGIEGLEVTQLADLAPRSTSILSEASVGVLQHLLKHLGYNEIYTDQRAANETR